MSEIPQIYCHKEHRHFPADEFYESSGGELVHKTKRPHTVEGRDLSEGWLRILWDTITSFV